MIKLFSLLAVAYFVIFGVVVGLLNPASVDINIFITTITIPLSVVMSVLFVAGMAVGSVIIFLQVLKYRWKIHAQVKQNQKLSSQIIELKKELVENRETKVKHELEESFTFPQLSDHSNKNQSELLK